MEALMYGNKKNNISTIKTTYKKITIKKYKIRNKNEKIINNCSHNNTVNFV